MLRYRQALSLSLSLLLLLLRLFLVPASQEEAKERGLRAWRSKSREKKRSREKRDEKKRSRRQSGTPRGAQATGFQGVQRCNG